MSNRYRKGGSVGVYYTIKINFPEKTWVRTDEPEDQESSKGRGPGTKKKYRRGVIG